MKKSASLFFAFALFCGNSQSNGKNISISEFSKMSPARQANHFNSLSTKEKMSFIAKLFPGNRFDYPPNEEMIFYKDGTVEVTSFSFNDRDYGFWKIKNNTLLIYPNKKKGNGKFFKMKILWRDPFAKGGVGDDRRLEILFKEGNSKKHMINILWSCCFKRKK